MRRVRARRAEAVQQVFDLPGIRTLEQLHLIELPEVIVECIREGGRLRIRPVSDGYDARLHCRFPYALRFPGWRYAVQRLDKVERGGRLICYRAVGEIRRLRDVTSPQVHFSIAEGASP